MSNSPPIPTTHTTLTLYTSISETEYEQLQTTGILTCNEKNPHVCANEDKETFRLPYQFMASKLRNKCPSKLIYPKWAYLTYNGQNKKFPKSVFRNTRGNPRHFNADMKALEDCCILRQLKNRLEAHYLFLKIGRLSGLRNVKEIQISFMDDGRLKLCIVHEVKLPDECGNNGRYLSIDLGLKNNFTCYDSANVETFILSGLLAKTHWFDKEIARLQSISDAQRVAEGEQYQKKSRRVLNLYKRKNYIKTDFLHKSTRFLVNYCVHHNLNTIVVGDWTKIRENKDGSAKDWGANGNAKLHGFPYRKFYKLMRYKCALAGIRFIVRTEAWTSQCPPDSLGITKEFAEKSKRVFRGMYCHNGVIYNADAVGAFNILRRFLFDEKLALDKINAAEHELFSLRAPRRVYVA